MFKTTKDICFLMKRFVTHPALNNYNFDYLKFGNQNQKKNPHQWGFLYVLSG